MMNRFFALTALVSLAGLGMAACAVDADEIASDEYDVKEKIFCGGIAGFACPDGMVCVDDPSDSCNPKKGGADCGGYCKKAPKNKCDHQPSEYLASDCSTIKFFCAQGFEPFFDDCGCGCTPVTGTPCGASTCGAGEFCCNESCGLCAPEGGGCIELFCGDAPQ